MTDNLMCKTRLVSSVGLGRRYKSISFSNVQMLLHFGGELEDDFRCVKRCPRIRECFKSSSSTTMGHVF